jgi:hypothetical protein
MNTMLKAQRPTAIGASLLAEVWLACLGPPVVAQEKAATTAQKKVCALAMTNTPWTGDVDALVAGRMIRVLVPYSRRLARLRIATSMERNLRESRLKVGTVLCRKTPT